MTKAKAGGVTPSQTVGPYFKYGLTPGGSYAWNDAFSNDLVTPDVSGNRIRIVGRVTDGDGKAVPDAMLEIWQPDAQGRFADPQDGRAPKNNSFKGFGRCGTDPDGIFSFHTIMPGPVPGTNGDTQAPHISLAIYARGMTQQLYTRIYFDGDPANKDDAVLKLVASERRGTIIATREGDAYRFDVCLQGEGETVFFEV